MFLPSTPLPFAPLAPACANPVAAPTTTAASVLVPREKEGDDPVKTLGRTPPSAPYLDVLYYDAARFIVLDKPPDVRMDGEFDFTVEKLLLDAIRARGFNVDIPPKGFAPRFVQRLDYATSGVMLVALSKHVAGIASKQFAGRTVRKCYTAVVHGHVFVNADNADRRADGADGLSEEPFLSWEWPLADGEGYKMLVGTPEKRGREAMTRCYPLAHGVYYGAPVTKVRLEPRTGRRHQLRVHCAMGGVPIVGDATYIPDDGVFFADKLFVPPRMMLHAARLEINMPSADQIVYGHKSGLRRAVPFVFEAQDPFVAIPGLTFSEDVR